MNSLQTVFGELGISQYLDSFIDQGFDSWDTILDITESDLDALGVKLGHRRRRIANFRGVAPDVSLALTARPSIEDARHDANRADFGRPNGKVAPTPTKRKYRRHPKPDDNAPERPPSAYVLFSNKMREDLKGQNLTFTEIAKLVGENWQNLDPTEKDPYERQANDTKQKYNHELCEYKKTADFRKYNDYLQDFRKRQAAQTQEKDAAKRLRTDMESGRSSSTSRASIGPSGTSGTSSSSDSFNGSEPPPSRQHRFGSMASLSNGTSLVDDSLTSPRLSAHEESSRERGLSSHRSRDASLHHRIAWADGQCLPSETSSSGIPLGDPKASPVKSTQPSQSDIAGRTVGQSSHSNGSMRGPRSSGSASLSRSPSKRESSSYGSSTSSHPHRTPNETSLPIYALLSRSESPGPPFVPTRAPALMQMPISLRQSQSTRGPAGFPPQADNSMTGHVPGSQFSHPGPLPLLSHEAIVTSMPDQPSGAVGNHSVSGGNALDGISALLKAREIVDRRL